MTPESSSMTPWRKLAPIFGDRLMSRLLGVSRRSVARYRSGERRTPEVVGARLNRHARVVHHLEGAYNALGVRRWFQRRRSALDGKSPADVLAGAWDPTAAESQSVLALARSLSGLGAT